LHSKRKETNNLMVSRCCHASRYIFAISTLIRKLAESWGKAALVVSPRVLMNCPYKRVFSFASTVKSMCKHYPPSLFYASSHINREA